MVALDMPRGARANASPTTCVSQSALRRPLKRRRISRPTSRLSGLRRRCGTTCDSSWRTLERYWSGLESRWGDEDEAEKLEKRQGDLRKRLAGKQAEKDRYVRLYAQGHISEVEAETDEAFQARRQLVKLLVTGITVGRKVDRSPKIDITYRFGPPSEAAGERGTEEMFVGSTQNALS